MKSLLIIAAAAVLLMAATVSSAATYKTFSSADPLPLDKLRLPPGFSISIVARVNNSRQIALNGNETWLFAGSFEAGNVVAVPIMRTSDGNYVPSGPQRIVAKGYNLPVGVA